MAAEPFTGIYSAALKDMCASIDPRDFVLFMLLCAYADNRGVCWPGVRELSDKLGWRFEEVRYRIDRLERQSLLRFKRRGKRDVDTGRFLPDVYEMNPRIYFSKTPVTHTAEDAEHDQFRTSPVYAEHDQFRIAPVEHAQPESEPEELTKSIETRISNQHQQPENSFEEVKASGTGEGDSAFKTEGTNPFQYTDTKANTQAAPAGTKPVPTGHAESNTPPSSAPPPSSAEWKPEPRYVNALNDAHLEALANELRTVAPTRLYNARELVMRYGEVNIRKGLAQLAAAKKKGNVYNPCGLLTTWLRNGAIQAEPAADAIGTSYAAGKYADYIES